MQQPIAWCTGLFECQDLGLQTLKGISTPLSLYRVIRESAAQSRFEVAISTGLTPFIGREPELGVLRQHWEQARAGDGQVVLLSGEPGIGKSRLVQEFKEQLGRDGVTRLEFRCSPYHQNSALYPIIDHLQRLLQFAREDSPAAKLEKLQHTLEPLSLPTSRHAAAPRCITVLAPSRRLSADYSQSAEAEGEDAGRLSGVAGRGSRAEHRLQRLGRSALG